MIKKWTILTMLTLTTLPGCQSALRPTTPINTSFLLTQYLESENYALFNSMVSELSQENISEADFKQLVQLKKSGQSSTPSTSFQLYTTLTFDNGNMILVNFVPDPIDGKYLIQDVTLVPDEMKSLFEQTN